VSQGVFTDAQAIYNSVMSPFCPGRLLSNCPSPQAEELRVWIREQLAAGATREEVVDVLYATYGDAARGAPLARGLGLLAWLAPGAAILVGALLLLRRMGKLTRSGKDASPQLGPVLSDEDRDRLRKEMERIG
jgi:cytochrome c-type biogenesis protein CcmH/NrfF